MQSVDVLIAGGGAAGLSLACQLVRGPLHNKTILIVDCDAKHQNDRTWCYWTNHATLFDPVVCGSWRRLRVVADDFATTLDLGSYRYNLVRGIDFYRFAHNTLAAHPNVQLFGGRVERIDDGPEVARAVVDGQTIAANWVFDSRFVLPASERAATTSGRVQLLKQEFAGWEIDATREVFDPDQPTLMDFRTPQGAGLRFLHLVPFSPQRALVDFVSCASNTLGPAALHEALGSYLCDVLAVGSYHVLREEHGVTPMTDRPFPRRISQHVMAIGLPGGRAKPSTGYAYLRIQDDAKAIAQSLVDFGHPFAVPHSARRYRFFDAVLLDVLDRHPEDAVPIFTALFRRNPVTRIFRFLDEEASVWENARALPSLPSRLLERSLRDLGRLARV